MSIATETMVVNLQIGTWLGYRIDKDASRKVTSEANADDDAARVNKHLIPRDVLKPIVAAGGAVRTHFYTKTLPWKDNGDRLLTRKMYQVFVEEHELLSKAFYDAVAQFLDSDYPAAVAKAEFRMGDLFQINDYPRPETLRHRFYVNLDIDTVSEAGDFRVTLDQKHIDAIHAEMERAMQTRIARAVMDIWQRLADTLGHFTDKMSSDGIFRDSTVHNLEEIIELLPALNVTDDPALEAIRQDIKDRLIGYDPKTLRKDPATRAAVATDAQKIMDDMKGFMNAFAGA